MTHQEWKDLCKKAPVLLDGAFGTQLQERGLRSGELSEGWNLSHPDKVQSVAEAYVEAGSQIILTNTFGANRIILEQHGLGERTKEINRIGVERSRCAAGARAHVFGSIGPTGKMLMMGEVTEDELFTTFEEQAHALKEGGADGLVIETMSDLEEATLAVKAAVATELPVVACMVFDSGPERVNTMMGVSPEQAAEALNKAGAWAVGANCGQGPEEYRPVCEKLRKATDLPLWMKPNAGLPEIEDDKMVYRVTPEEFAQNACRLFEKGAAFIGGCCGTTPSFIKALAAQPGMVNEA